MLISVVIATYNSEKTLDECLTSLAEQSFKDFEVIIQDGASQDTTLAIIDKYKTRMRISVSSQTDSGVYDAWNRALKCAKGKWITFLGSDDLINSEDSLERVAEDISKMGPDIGMLFGKNIIIDLEGNQQEEIGQPWSDAKEKLNREMSVRHPGSFYTKELITSLKGFDDTYKIIGDYDFVIRANKICKGWFYDYSAIRHRIGGLSISPSRCLDIINETIKLRKKHNLRPYLYIDTLFLKRLFLYLVSKVFGTNNSVRVFGFYQKVICFFKK